MSKRVISASISNDLAINKLATEHGDFAVLLYTWLIAHTSDDGIVHGNSEVIKDTVFPHRDDITSDDVLRALFAMSSIKNESGESLVIYKEEGVVFPHESFYKHQPLIKKSERREDDPLPDDNYDIEEKLASVLELLPTKKSPIAQTIVRDAIAKYYFLDKEACVSAMRATLDYWNKPQHANRTDWASLFSRQLGWAAKQIQDGLDELQRALTPEEFDSLREQEREYARQQTENMAKRLDNL